MKVERERRGGDKVFEGEGPFGEVSRRGDDDRAAATFCVCYFTGGGDIIFVMATFCMCMVLIRVLFVVFPVKYGLAIK